MGSIVTGGVASTGSDDGFATAFDRDAVFMVPSSLDDDPDAPRLSKKQRRALEQQKTRLNSKAYKQSTDAEIDRLLTERSAWAPAPVLGKEQPKTSSDTVLSFTLGALVATIVFLFLGIGFFLFRDGDVPNANTAAENPSVALNATQFDTLKDNAASQIASPTNALGQSLHQIGALNCIARANQLPDAISKHIESIVLPKPQGDANASLLSAMLLPSAASKIKGVSILSLAPEPQNGCGAIYQSIDVIEKPCATAVPEIFGPNRATPVGTNGFSLIALTQLARVLAIPSSNSCVLVKLESVP